MYKKKIYILIALFVTSVSGAQTISFFSSSWNLEHSPNTFIHDVAMSCLTAAAAHVKAEGKTISLEDDQNCSTEIRALSMVWDQSPQTPMKSINTRRLNEARIQKAIKDHFGGLSSIELKLLPSGATNGQCPCMVLSGSKAEEAVTFLKDQFPTDRAELLSGPDSH